MYKVKKTQHEYLKNHKEFELYSFAGQLEKDTPDQPSAKDTQKLYVKIFT